MAARLSFLLAMLLFVMAIDGFPSRKDDAIEKKEKDVTEQEEDDGNMDLKYTTKFHIFIALGKSNEILTEYEKERGLNINKKDDKGRAPIHYAALYDQETSVRFLCDHHANIELEVLESSKDKNGTVQNVSTTPVQIAMGAESHKAFTELLIGCEASPKLPDTEDNLRDIWPIHFAAKHGNIKVVKYLVENKTIGVDFMEEDESKTALMFAAENNQTEVVKYLIDKGADCTLADEDGFSPLHFAAEAGSHETVEYLLRNSSWHFDQPDKYGKTPLMVAIGKGHLPIANLLIEKGSEVHRISKDNMTILHYAAASGMIEIVEKLKSIDINARDSSNGTPLHFCAANGQEKFCDYLLKNNANMLATNNENRTAEEVAEDNKYLNMKFFLKLYNNRTSVLNANGDLHFISKAVSASASKIETYVDFVTNQNTFSSTQHATLEKIKKMVNGSLMVEMFEKFDSHLVLAQTHAGKWRDIYMQEVKAFHSVKRFGATFLRDFRSLDLRVPGLMGAIHSSKIEEMLRKYKKELKELGYPKSLIKKKIEELRKQLEGKGRYFDEYIDEIKHLLNHTLEYGVECKDNAKTAHDMLHDFSLDLGKDKTVFESDLDILNNVTDLMNSSVTKQIEKLEKLANTTGNYQELAKNSIAEIRNWQTVHFAVGGIGTSLQIMSHMAGLGSFVNSFKMSSRSNKLSSSLSELKSTEKRYGQVSRIQKKKIKHFQEFEKLKKAKTQHRSAVTRYSNKVKSSAKLGKGLEIGGALLGLAATAFSIADMVTSSMKMKELEQEHENVGKYTELFMRSKLEIAGLNSDLVQIGMTAEQRDAAKVTVLECIEKVSGALNETKLLADLWSNIVGHLQDMLKEADKANGLVDEATKHQILDNIRSKLINMRDSWSGVELSAIEIMKTQQKLDKDSQKLAATSNFKEESDFYHF